MVKSDQKLRELAELEKLYPERDPQGVAHALLLTWAFTGQTREDHEKEKARLIKFIELTRKMRLEKKS